MVQTKREKHQAYSASSQSQAANDFKLESEEWSMLSRVRFFATPWAVAHQVPLSMGFSRQEYWSGLPFPSAGDLSNPEIKPRFPTLQADSLPSEPLGKPKNTGVGILSLL